VSLNVLNEYKKGKVAPVHAVKAHMTIGGTPPPILILALDEGKFHVPSTCSTTHSPNLNHIVESS
jgi:hypothetical protein